ncbi:MAG: glycosyltransferase family 39 protein [Verrucomicrobiales bacterium]|nr:glycosyltransferase family 39 protein [Verrucomicrobiales bacterium]
MNSNLPHTLLARLKHWWQNHKSNDAAVVCLLLAILCSAIAYLMWGDDPWRRHLPQKFLAGEYINNRNGIILGLWFAAAINAAISVILLLSSRWWPEPTKQKKPLLPKPSSSSIQTRRLFYIGLFSALLVAGWIRAPRLEHSFWNDEEMAFRKFLWGENVLDTNTPDNKLRYKPVSWKRSFFYTSNGNNHVTQTISSRLYHEVWKYFFLKDGDRPFQESVIRLSPFISGLLGISALAFLLRTTGYPLAGITAAWLLAINPWHLRYSVEARGYADLMLFIPLTFIALLYALRTARWRWWILYGLFQCLCLLAFAGAIYLVAAQNLIVLGLLIQQRKPHQLWRWGVSSSIGAMLFITMVTPMVIRVIDYAKTHQHDMAPITVAHWRDFWSHLVIGAPWKTMADPSLHNGLSTQMYQSEHPSVFWLMAFIIPLTFISGLIWTFLKNPQLRIFISSILGSLVLLLLHNALSETIFLIWYIIYTVLLFSAALAFAPELLQRCTCFSRQKHTARYVATAYTVIMILGYGWLCAPSIARLRQFEREPMREAVTQVRGATPALDPDNQATLTCSIGSGAAQMRSYDPWVHPVKKVGDFEQIVKEAREKHKKLFIYVCSPLRVKREYPHAWQQLNDQTTFEKTVYLKGLEEFWSYQIYRLKTAPPASSKH